MELNAPLAQIWIGYHQLYVNRLAVQRRVAAEGGRDHPSIADGVGRSVV
jgi:hypothetical protein